MDQIYASPTRVYLCLIAIAIAGILSGFQLPVSLFPQSSKPTVTANIPYGNLTVKEFVAQHGTRIETQLQAISRGSVVAERIKSKYLEDGIYYDVEFKWGADPQSALKEVEAVVSAYASRFSDEVRNQIWIWPKNENTGFFAASFFSSERSLDDVYRILEPVLGPPLLKVKDASPSSLWNPSEREIRIQLNQEKMAAYQLYPKDVDLAVKNALTAHSGGAVMVGIQKHAVLVPRLVSQLDDLSQVLIRTPGNQLVHLTDIAEVDFDLKTINSASFKTTGTPSLIYFVRPRPGGNVKKMSEDILKVIQTGMLSVPKDIQCKILVDPSEFIRSSIQNVFKEVVIGSLLAVFVLFLFIGSVKNTVTAAIEIPLSLVMAFIPMKLSGMSINLISLGGLALSAGMNVDASVVVMENIFRHFEGTQGGSGGELDFKTRLQKVVQAVNEVKIPVIGSTIASLVVFIPLAFTSDLAYAILGDLAKAVVFSHGCSAIVALILVPTVRLQLMNRKSKSGLGAQTETHSPLEKQIRWLENAYSECLRTLFQRKNLQRGIYLGLGVGSIALALLVLPRLPTEVIGKPDTDWVEIMLTSEGNTLLRQMEDQSQAVEKDFLKKHGSVVQYTFTQVYQPNAAWMMVRLKDKSKIKESLKEFEKTFVNTPLLSFRVNPWNPAELPIPDPPQMRIVVRNGRVEDRAWVARDIHRLIEENTVFPRISTTPTVQRSEGILLKPLTHVWSALQSQGVILDPSHIADLIRTMTAGRKIGELEIDTITRDVTLAYADRSSMTAEEIGSIPIGVTGKLIPLKALHHIQVQEITPSIYREDGREMILITGRETQGDTARMNQERVQKAKKLVEEWKKKGVLGKIQKPAPTVEFEQADQEIQEALNQLIVALGISIALIFLILMIQFGDWVSSFLVLLAVPFGLIGVLTSLFVFRSTLSLNSVLGVILLNGIAVANSIILVDCIRKGVLQGLSPLEAALAAARQRLRPILITSLTTILGMLPIAFGLGEGGKILQPLGIAVSGGLWVSMTLTLLVVPVLQVRYLNWKQKLHLNPVDPVESSI